MKLLLISMALVVSSCAAPTKDESATQTQWRHLFNGHDMTGWTPKIKGHPLGKDPYQTVRVQDGLLRIDYSGYDGTFDERFLHLYHDEAFDNYHLLVEYRFHGEQVPGGPGWAWRNSGAMLHCQPPESMGLNQSFPVSIEGQFLGGDGTNHRPTGNLCTPGTHVVMDGVLKKAHCINSASDTKHGDVWVVAEFIVRDGHIDHYIDGMLVMSYDNPQYDPTDADAQAVSPGKDLPLNRGWISLQGESHPIDFRRVDIKSLQ